MAWKGTVLKSKEYSSIVDEITAIAGGTPYAIRLSEFLEDFRQCLIPREIPFEAPANSGELTIAHGFDRAPSFVAIQSFQPEFKGGDAYGVAIMVGETDDTNISLVVQSPGKVTGVLVAMLGTKYL